MTTAAAAAKDNTGSGNPAAAATGGETKTAEQIAAETAATAAAAATPAAAAAHKPASTDGQAPPESKAPAKYALTLPDGGRIDEHDLATIEAHARQQGLTNDEAQALVTPHADAINAQSARFTDETKTDAVYGGAQFDSTIKHANAALDILRPKGTPRGDAFRGLLAKSGYGNHLEVVSFLADLGKLMAEDGSYGAGGDQAVSTDAATLIYGTDKAVPAGS